MYDAYVGCVIIDMEMMDRFDFCKEVSGKGVSSVSAGDVAVTSPGVHAFSSEMTSCFFSTIAMKEGEGTVPVRGKRV